VSNVTLRLHAHRFRATLHTANAHFDTLDEVALRRRLL